MNEIVCILKSLCDFSIFCFGGQSCVLGGSEQDKATHTRLLEGASTMLDNYALGW